MTAPSIEYAQLLPIILVLAAGVLGVLVEAFAPRVARHPIQVAVALVALVSAFIQVIRLAGTEEITAVGSIAIDGPALFLQGTILALAAVSILFFAERKLEGGGDAFAPAASSLPGSEEERVLVERGKLQTEIYPLAM